MDNASIYESTHQERRRYGRLEGKFSVEIVFLTGSKSGDQITGQVVNISREGIGLVTSMEIQSGTQLSMIVYVAEYDSICVGHVVWAKEVQGQYLHGVRINRWSYLDFVLENQLPRSASIQ